MMTAVSEIDEPQTEAMRARPGTDRRLVRSFQLRVEAGPERGRTFVSDRDRVTVGTHESNQLVLTDRTVSRFHCDLSLERDQVVVRDLQSRNCTLVNGVQVREAFLTDGMQLTLGETRLIFRTGSEQISIPLSPQPRFGSMVGQAAATRATFAQLERAAATDTTVLLLGETGTGKEAAAESLHRESARRDRPFVIVDCAAVPPDLMESELFGHRRGSFTGADAEREGAFEAADGGTIFLDEIGELPLDLQAKLLRVLERRSVKRIGENDYRPVDVRVIAATNRDLRQEVNAKRFRSDLYYRVAVLEIALPPLRDRQDDLPLLVRHLLSGLRADPAQLALYTGEEMIARLREHPWPGNVRELRNHLERCLALRSPVGPPAQAASPVPVSTVEPEDFRDARARWTTGFLERLLARHENNVTAAARAAGMDRIHLYRLLRQHGLR
jgi:transcriptional regulator with PAS, ATPase and Fis domain